MASTSEVPAPNEKTETVATTKSSSADQDATEVRAKETDGKDKPIPQDEKPKDEKPKDNQPPGGFDATPIPKVDRGYTVKFIFHRASNLPIADLKVLSSDPYILAQLNVDVPTRHKEDPPLRFRTPTIHESTEPVWNEEWTVANVPASGFRLKLRIYDEDPNDSDDRLGNVSIVVDSIGEDWSGQKEQAHKIQPRSGSKRAYAIRGLAKCFGAKEDFHGLMYVSIQVLGRTKEDGQNGRLYTAGPCRWVEHFSPMLGRLTNTKDDSSGAEQPHGEATSSRSQRKKNVQQYNFQANQMQLQGPVPPPLYHRYVEFKKFVKRMFTASGIGGTILSKALHHQHARVYNFSPDTIWGHFPDGPSIEMTKKFLELVRWDKGGRIFTYVLTLDALFRFTETGKEFSIDMLSKHTMHSDVSIYIAFSGEFFIRRLKHPRKPPPPEPVEATTYGQSEEHTENPTYPPEEDAKSVSPSDDSPQHPSHYELVIDNDSGTYRPNAKLLPQLKKFLAQSFPGLHVQVLDCQKDAEKMSKMKKEQRERKKKEGDHIIVMQGSRTSSFSSSEDEDFDRIQESLEQPDGEPVHDRGVLEQATKDLKRKQQAHWQKTKHESKLSGRSAAAAQADADRAEPDAHK